MLFFRNIIICVTFKDVKCLVLRLGHNNPTQQLGEGWLESCPAEKHSQGSDCPLVYSIVRQHLECCEQFWDLH